MYNIYSYLFLIFYINPALLILGFHMKKVNLFSDHFISIFYKDFLRFLYYIISKTQKKIILIYVLLLSYMIIKLYS